MNKVIKDVFQDYKKENNIINATIIKMNLYKKSNKLELNIKSENQLIIDELADFETYLSTRFSIQTIETKVTYPEIELIREIDNIKNLTKNENVEESGTQESEEIKDEEVEQLYINMDFFGLNLAQVPTQSSDWKAYVIPVLYVLISILSMKITNTTTPKTENKETVENNDEKALTKPEEEFDPTAYMQKNMNIMMPIMYVSIALIAPLGLALYWLMNSLLMIAERLLLNKLLKDEEEN